MIYYHHENEKPEKVVADNAFLREVARLTPVARGTVSLVRKPCNRPNCKLCKGGKKHSALIFTCRVDGKGKCFHVQPKHESIMRKAVENGTRLEALMAKAGVNLVLSLREPGD